MNRDKNLLEPIAIVGLGGVFPGAPDVPSFWRNILEKKNSIVEVPGDRWDWKLYYDPDPSAPDKTYSKIGGFVLDLKFDPLKLRIPPPVAQQMDMVQKMAVAATAEALRDSGYDQKPFDSRRAAVILGNSMGGTKKEATDMRVYSAFFKNRLENSPAFRGLPPAARRDILAEMEQGVKSSLSTITEDTMPGELSNVIAGRVASAFNFNGANFTVDAACASSLAALDQAVNGLRSREYDMVFCGGVDQMMSPPAYVKFCKIGALSPDGSRPFDAAANGFVMGEGAGVCVLKRLSDALKDGDRVYALVRAVGSSSDGRGKAITAPNPRGQRLAIERVFEQLEYSPGDVGLLEAHGTSTKVGDVVEANTAAEIFGPCAPKGSIALGSVKSQIGHLKAAAGVASLIKTVMALHHKTLPPSANFRVPNPGIDWDHSPFFVPTEPMEWTGRKTRRADVSAFGFGGANFHVALEEASSATTARWSVAAKAAQARPSASAGEQPSGEPESDVPEMDPEVIEIDLPPSKLNINPSVVGEALFVHGATPNAVFDRLAAWAPKIPEKDSELFAFASGLNSHFKRDEYCLCLAAESAAKLREKIDFILKNRAQDLWEKTPPAFKPKGIYLGGRRKPGKIGMVFPGQGSQYVDMLRDLKEKYSIVADTFAEADKILQEAAGYRLTEALFTRGGETPEKLAAIEERIKQTEITQPAVLAADVAILRLLEAYGVRPDVVCGHSLGEYAALVAARVLDFKDALLAVSARAKEMSDVQVPDHGKMASVAAPMEKVEPVLKKIEGYVAAANKNCPSQTVIAGESRAVEAAVKAFGALGVTAQEIRVSHAFHSKIVAPAQASYRKFLERIPVHAPKIPILSNVTAAYYPDDAAEIRELLVAQIASPVEFIRQVERMHQDGVRLFVEAGPKRVLTAFVSSTLEDKKDSVALSSNHPKRGGILEFNELLARLVAEGVDIQLPTKTLTPPEKRGGFGMAPLAPSHRTGEDVQARDSALERWGFYTGSVAVSGIAAGTPGAWDRVFRNDNLDQLLRGQNLIGKLSDRDVQDQLDKNVVRLIKSATGDHRLERLRDAAEVIQLAGLAGEFDLAKEFGFKESVAAAMDVSSKLAVAAGILALQDAGIPLVPVYKETTTGSSLPAGWSLPASMRDGTGIIFATSFPSIDSMASEVSRYLADKYRRKPLRELAALLESLISRLKDPEDRAAVERWYASHLRVYEEKRSAEGPYEFSREFLLKVLPIGHAQLAQWIGARGPATQISNACASTTQAVAMAEDWIRLGRAERVIVIAGDDVTSPNLREWLLTGFLAAGAATTSSVVSEAALPFDRRRNGLILGMGATALVVERSERVSERGMRPLAEILAGEYANSAFHITRLHPDHISQVMKRLISKAEKRWGISRKEMASKTLFMSHETYTPARGGSASAEVQALKTVFEYEAGRIVVANTKGYTGHTMGASIEDSLAIRALTTGLLPPIANYREPDPELAGITLSRGGEYDLEYAIRLGAGFGSQIAMTLTKRVLRKGESRVSDPDRRQKWLREISGQDRPELEVVCNTLRVRDSKAGAKPRSPLPVPVAVSPRMPAPGSSTIALPAGSPIRSSLVSPGTTGSGTTPAAAPRQTESAVAAATTKPSSRTLQPQEIQQAVVQLVSEKTGYPAEMLELDLDMEADLGIDTVKQAEIVGILREKYSIPRQENLILKNYPTLRHVIRFVMESSSGAAVAETPSHEPAAAPGTAGSGAAPVDENILQSVLRLVSEKTGYPVEMLELDLDMEADLGIDTVKQAEVFGILREKYSIPRKENLALKDYPTLRHLIRFVQESSNPGSPSLAATAREGEASPSASAPVDPIRYSIAVPETAGSGATPSADVFKRWVPKAVERPLKETARAGERFLKKGQSVAILCSQPETAKPFIQALKATGVSATVLRRAEDAADTHGLLHLGGLELAAPGPSLLKSFDSQYIQAVRSLFLAVKARQKALDSENRWIVALTRRDKHPLAGAISGLIKALGKEFPKSKIQAVDFESSTPIREIVKAFLSELNSDERESEVRYAGGKRFVCSFSAEKLPDGADVRSLDKRSTVVVTGGGQGLGAECAKAVASRWQSRLVILGRTPLAPEAEKWAAMDDAGLKSLKQELWEKLKADKSQKATPALLEKKFAPIAKAASLYRNLQSMRASGSEVLYLETDLSDAGQVRAAVKKMGAIKPDLVLHAAGLEESKRLEDKTPERFDAVFRAKAHAAAHLLEYLPSKKGQAWVFFSSVTGRFGNAGQADYAAASDFLSKLAESLRSKKIQAVSVELTAISDIGMATRGGAEQFLKSQGVDFMPPAKAVAMILDEALRNPGDAEVLLAGSLGRLDSEGRMLREKDLPADAPPSKMEPVTIHKEFSLQSDPWLSDHSIAGTPYVAGVMGLELFAEAAAKATGKTPAGFEDVRFSLPIKLLRQKPIKVRAIAERARRVIAPGAARAENDLARGAALRIESDFTTPQGIKLGAPRTHFTAKISNELPAEAAEVSVPKPAEAGRFAVAAEAIYSAYFHGPSFQVLGGILSVSEDAVVAAYREPSKPLWPAGGKKLAFQPMLIEAAFQACGYRDIRCGGKMTLPDSIGRVAVWNHSHAKDLYVFARYKGLDNEGKSVYDARVVDDKKRVWVSLRDYKMIPVS